MLLIIISQIQASGTRIAKFNELQIQSGIRKALKIPLHSNIRWGSAFYMLDRALALQNVCSDLSFNYMCITINFAGHNFIYQLCRPFIQAHHFNLTGWMCWKGNPLDSIFPISWGLGLCFRCEGYSSCKLYIYHPFCQLFTDHVTRTQIEFKRLSHLRRRRHYGNRFCSSKTSKLAGKRSVMAKLVLSDSQHTAWLSRMALTNSGSITVNLMRNQRTFWRWVSYFYLHSYNGCWLILIVLHPYYKLDYIQLAWGGEKEQEEERLAGNFVAKNWQDEALRIFEQMVWFSGHSVSYFTLLRRLKPTGRAILKKWMMHLMRAHQLWQIKLMTWLSLILTGTAYHNSRMGTTRILGVPKFDITSRQWRQTLLRRLIS